ncbi:MAG TPA: tRNA uridine-5-carboxymethylaminomethyl(34) synthesis GTPase MnmE [Gammaproteobacteria bacterium]|nr:tRNA uridine-5-carboxymethylaminomethyl(34) synthesis GTPase MnmE [Gammaproteobacteria bacterium]
MIDEGLLVYFSAPHSYTGEDVVEVQCHGNDLIINSIEETCCRLGARRARPGEFTERAFLNGKLDLTQAEAVADLIGARSASAVKASLNSLQGVFSSRLRTIQQALMHLRIWVESSIDFSDEGVDILSDQAFIEKKKKLEKLLCEAIEAGRKGAILNNGINIAIIGPPNAGKSSLMNTLTQAPTSIVTASPGTTRDVIKESINIDGVCFNLLDTAGIHQSTDTVEKIGIQRTLDTIGKADYCWLVFDQTVTMPKPEEFWGNYIKNIPFPRENYSIVLNKSDCIKDPAPYPYAHNALSISAKTGEGVATLLERVKDFLKVEEYSEGAFSARERHLDLLEKTKTHVKDSMTHLAQSQLELASEDLRLAQQQLGSILGEVTSDDLLGEIFSSFCIGK